MFLQRFLWFPSFKRKCINPKFRLSSTPDLRGMNYSPYSNNWVAVNWFKMSALRDPNVTRNLAEFLKLVYE
jgi:hypothetical protein